MTPTLFPFSAPPPPGQAAVEEVCRYASGGTQVTGC